MSYASFARKIENKLPLTPNKPGEFYKGQKIKYWCGYTQSWVYGVFDRIEEHTFYSPPFNKRVYAYWDGKHYTTHVALEDVLPA